MGRTEQRALYPQGPTEISELKRQQGMEASIEPHGKGRN